MASEIIAKLDQYGRVQSIDPSNTDVIIDRQVILSCVNYLHRQSRTLTRSESTKFQKWDSDHTYARDNWYGTTLDPWYLARQRAFTWLCIWNKRTGPWTGKVSRNVAKIIATFIECDINLSHAIYPYGGGDMYTNRIILHFYPQVCAWIWLELVGVLDYGVELYGDELPAWVDPVDFYEMRAHGVLACSTCFRPLSSRRMGCYVHEKASQEANTWCIAAGNANKKRKLGTH